MPKWPEMQEYHWPGGRLSYNFGDDADKVGDNPEKSSETWLWCRKSCKNPLKSPVLTCRYDAEKISYIYSKLPEKTTFLAQDKNQTNYYKSIKRHSRRNTFKTQSLVRNKLPNHYPNRWTDGLLKRSAATLKLATNPKFQSMLTLFPSKPHPFN